MSKKTLAILTLISASSISSSYAAFTVNLDAGLLKGPGGADTMVSDNTLGSPNGSLLLLIDEGPNNTPQNSLVPGEYVSGDDTVLAAGGFNSNSGTHDETQTSFTNITGGTSGDLIALRWFPGITYTQYLASTTPIVGQNFGTYNPLAAGNGTNNPDGGNLWAVPGPGSTIALNFFTTDDFVGGTQAPSEGYANFTVLSAVPEPSTYAAMARLLF